MDTFTAIRDLRFSYGSDREAANSIHGFRFSATHHWLNYRNTFTQCVQGFGTQRRLDHKFSRFLSSSIILTVV